MKDKFEIKDKSVIKGKTWSETGQSEASGKSEAGAGTSAQQRRGAFWNMMGSGMMSVNTVVLSMLVSNFFDLDEVGRFTLALTTAQILYSLALFGANDRQMLDYGHRYHFADYFWVKVSSTILAAIVCVITSAAMGSGAAARNYTYLLTAFMLVNSFAELYQAMYFQNNRLDLSGKSLFYRYLSSTVAFLVVILAGGTVVAACVWMLAVDIAVTLFWVLRYEKTFRDSGYVLQREPVKLLTREVFPLYLSVLGSLLIINCPKYLINYYLSDDIQGAYSILFMPTYVINLLGQFIFKPYYARYSQVLLEEKKGFRRLFSVHAAAVAVFALVCGFGMWLLGVPLLRIFFGQDLSAYRGMMFLFVLSGGLLAINQLLYYIMVIISRQKMILVNYLIGLTIAVLVGFAAVPRLGIAGAWLAFTVGQMLLLAGYLLILLGFFRWGKSV
ncbi:MAG: lipopolysaccharide biosynthesis protein [Lachnospiraceae bacterium]|nr:lipopolysaccharide biosynthesis protein [Lachnospiraceae bacterium]